MSALLSRQADKPHDIFDDLESLLWVLLFFAVRNFKYQGYFNMQVFKECREIPDKEAGLATVGGNWKYSWLSNPETTFECKPLQNFFDSFRHFHNEHYTKFANDDEDQELEPYEAEVRSDVYALLSHFDNILNDPNADWTGQEVNYVTEDVEQDSSRELPIYRFTSDEQLRSIPSADIEQGSEVTRASQKRKRGGSEDDNENPRKRIATARDDDDDAPSNIQPIRAHSRRRTPVAFAPTDRTLRPRTRR